MKRTSKGRSNSTHVQPLRIEEVTVKLVNYDELDRFITDSFGHGYTCLSPATEQWCRDSEHVIVVDGNLNTLEIADAQKFKRTGDANSHVTVHVLMNYLAREGKLDKGVYLVVVSD